MGEILGVGNATLDIVNVVDHYPDEDQEVRALSQHINRGGNATNTLVTLSQLGHRCAWAGTLADEPDARLIRADLDRYGIDTSAVHTLDHGKVPTSYIALSRATGSRTIVHHRDLPEYSHTAFERIDLGRFNWLHFEGRNLAETRRMLERARRERPELSRSVEIEKPRRDIETLFPLAKLLFFSKDYARFHGFHDAPTFLQQIRERVPHTDLICSWGEKGAWAVGPAGGPWHAPAFPPARLVDTLGAGDVFNAGIIDARLRGASLDIALIEASRLAGRKCGQYGLHGLGDK